jgi:hypothetical protein
LRVSNFRLFSHGFSGTERKMKIESHQNNYCSLGNSNQSHRNAYEIKRENLDEHDARRHFGERERGIDGERRRQNVGDSSSPCYFHGVPDLQSSHSRLTILLSVSQILLFARFKRKFFARIRFSDTPVSSIGWACPRERTRTK